MMASGNDAANVLAYNVGNAFNPDGNGINGIDTFIGIMNDTAAQLGAVNTSFANAHGLHEYGNWSCAYDLAIITKYVYEKYELFRKICVAQEYLMPGNERISPYGYRIGNGNSLLRIPSEERGSIYYRDFVYGVKNGALDEYFLRNEAGEWVRYSGITSLASIGKKYGRSYVVVTLEAPFKTGNLDLADGGRMSRLHYCYVDHIKLYDWLFKS
jgi:hypothetical protein